VLLLASIARYLYYDLMNTSAEYHPGNGNFSQPMSDETRRYLARRALRSSVEMEEGTVEPSHYVSEWRLDAACISEDTELFFSQKPKVIIDAKKVCHTCPVKDVCAEYALSGGIGFGVWGELSERERAAILRRRRK